MDVSAINQRIVRIKKIMKTIEENPSSIEFNKLKLVCCQDWFISEKTAKEYINHAMFQTQTIIKDGIIVKNEVVDNAK